jgi:primosomal protein N'
MRRARSLAHQRAVMRFRSAIAVRLAEEGALRRELATERARREELAQTLSSATRALEAWERSGTAPPVWLPQAVRAAHASCVRAPAALPPRAAVATAQQELRACDARLQQLQRTLLARTLEAPGQQAALDAQLTALP